MKLRTTLLAAAVLLSVGTAANAAQISGSFSFAINPVQTDTVDLSKATAIYFSSTGNQFTSFTPLSGFQPSSVTSCGNCGHINDITGLPPGSSTSPFTAISPLFTVGNLSFSLTSLTSKGSIGTQPNQTLAIIGAGMFYDAADGYDATPGTFNISVNESGQLTATIESANGTGTATPVSTPEPASLAILGGSLAAIGFLRRRKNG